MLFISCDCLVHIQGVVIDSKTRLPIKTPKDEYKEILWDTRIKPHSSRDIEHWGNWMYDYPDTTFFGIFNTIDLDTMSLEEFKSKFPIKHEFKVTLQDMIDRDWTLIYPPSEKLLCVGQILAISRIN